MSDPKRATLITVDASKSAKKKVNKTVRLTINLDESNESKYSELNYKELLTAAADKERQNGKTSLNVYGETDQEAIEIARKFEEKYGGQSTYGRKGKSKYSDYVDIGAGYDENSFIDNTDGYDEMIPPDTDTFYGGFYINCGSLEFKPVSDSEAASDGDNRPNKRRMSSSSSDEMLSSSDSDSDDEKDPKAIANGTVDLHETEHRKKRKKNIDQENAKKIQRTDSSAATSGKQTSDEAAQGDAESADSRTSQSDSLTSKPAPSSENAVTSDSSRDAEAKVDVKLPEAVSKLLEDLEVFCQKNNPKDENKTDQFIIRLHALLAGGAAAARRGAWARAARALRERRPALRSRARALAASPGAAWRAPTPLPQTTSDIAQSTANTGTITTITTTISTNTTTNVTTTVAANNKRKAEALDKVDIGQMTPDDKEAKIVETLQSLKVLIDDCTPAMMALYNSECERVQEEKRKQTSEGAGAERRLPKRRFPWCARSRALLARLAALAGDARQAAALLTTRALPLFPPGFVRMPTLLKQADLNKEVKASDLKRQRVGSTSQSVITKPFPEPIQFPSSLTVTTSVKSYDKPNEINEKYKVNPAAVFGSIMNSYTLKNDLVIEPSEERKKDLERSKEEYIPRNNTGSITITPVLSMKEKKNSTVEKKDQFLTVMSPAALNEMVTKKDNKKKIEKITPKRVQSPIHIDTNHAIKKDSQSPKANEEISHKQIESMRIGENNIPRPGLISVNSPTFAKPQRPPKKKDDIEIVHERDPLEMASAVETVEDSDSDIEVVEDKSDRCEPKSDSVSVPLKDSKVNSMKKCESVFRKDIEEATNDEINDVMRNLREMEQSQEPTKLSCNSYGGVITSAKREMSSKQIYGRPSTYGLARSNRDKLPK